MIKLTKDQVIETILTEPLRSNRFFHTDALRDDGECEVCAIGSLLRKTGRVFNYRQAWRLCDYTSAASEIDSAYKKNFFAILSCEFEAFCASENHVGHEDIVRFHLLNVIEAFCPELLEIPEPEELYGSE